MAYQATVLPVMIASPGDVTEERHLVRSVIHEWNDLNAASTKRVLLPVGWDSHSAPDLSGRPQQIINDRVLKNCDLLIGIFWSRLGSPTGVSASGTVEEIEEHIAAGKPAMIYFSSVPIAQQQLREPEFQARWAALQEFKQWCRSKGIVWEFANILELREQLVRHLQINLRDSPYLNEISLPNVGGVNAFVGVPPRHNAEFALSEEASVLLKEASKDRNGTILNARYIGGQAIQTNGRNMIDSGDRRSVARWEAALNQLLEQELVVERGHKGEVFEVTDLGYRVADQISLD